jgi:hypothetical protein
VRPRLEVDGGGLGDSANVIVRVFAGFLRHGQAASFVSAAITL